MGIIDPKYQKQAEKMTLGAKALRRISRISKRSVSNHGFETDPIIPQFWRGKDNILDQQKYLIDTTNENMMDGPKKNPQLARKMMDTFEKTGLVLMRGNREVGDHLDVMRDWANLCFPNVSKYEGGANQRHGTHVANVYEVGAPNAAWLHFHHEMAYVNESVESIGFCAYEAIEDPKEPLRGATFVSEQFGCTRDVLNTEFGQKLKDKGICYIRCLTDKTQFGDDMEGVYNHWQTSFMTDDPKEAQRRAEAKGLKVEWGENGYMKTKCYISGYEYAPKFDQNVLYSAIADHSCWFDTWPEMAWKPYMKTYEGANVTERPLAITFGDDSEMTREELQTFVDVYDDHGVPIAWEKGDITAICNYRFAHGRPNFEVREGEKRELGVILGQMYRRQGQNDQKWANSM